MSSHEFYNQTEIAYLRSLNDSDLERLLAGLPRHEQIAALQQLMESDGRGDESDLGRKRDKRRAAAEVHIPPVADIERRNACLADPERFLRTYFASIFYNPFASHHKRMIAAMWERAHNGGDKAVAAPRGDGKSQIAVCMTAPIVLATPIRFPVLIGNTRKKGGQLFRQFKNKFSNRRKFPEFAADFPEVTAPVRALAGSPQRAATQHVRGVNTDIIWSQDAVRFPYVEGSAVSGKRVAFFGLDQAIRGEGDEEDRPDMAIIDDPETREVAFSPTDQHEVIEQIIDGDVAGLAGPNSTVARVVLTTIQNRRCYSYRVTDPKVKPTFAGERLGILAKWPERRDLWDEYIAIRQKAQNEGDKDGLAALAFYLANREEMQRGSEITNPYRFNTRLNAEGVAVEVSAIQAFFNRVADWGLARVLAELQNDPEEEATDETLGLTAGKVQSRISGLSQGELPKTEGVIITVGLDLGKNWSHWVKVAWHGNATGCIIDYGIMESPGLAANADTQAVELALLKAMLNWRTDILAENPPELCLIDSGSYSHAVYAFCNQVGKYPFAASKGWDAGRFHMGTASDERWHFDQCWAGPLKAESQWLYNVNTEHWKHWVHQRFNTPTFSDQHVFNDGSLSLFAAFLDAKKTKPDQKKHVTIAHHIVSEELRETFVEGKGLVRKWWEVNKNNHYLDALALACAAAGCLGVRLIPREPVTVTAPVSRPSVVGRVTMPDGRPYLVTERK